MDQLRAPVIRLPEEPPPFAADQPSERRFIYLRPPHMNVIITPARPPGVGCGGGAGAPLLHFQLAPPPPLPPSAHSVSRPSSLPTVFFRCWSLRRARYYLTAVMGGGWGASERARGEVREGGQGREREKKKKEKKKLPGSYSPHSAGRRAAQLHHTWGEQSAWQRSREGERGRKREREQERAEHLVSEWTTCSAEWGGCGGLSETTPSNAESRARVSLGALNKVLFTFDGSGGAEWKGRGHTQGHAGEENFFQVFPLLHLHATQRKFV